MPPPAFSRIALAAALIEYDNDPEDPTNVQRSAQESAIFAHLRKSGPIPKPQSVMDYEDLPEPKRSKNYLSVALPSDADAGLMSPVSPHDGASGYPSRRSRETRRSLDILRDQGEEYFQRAERGEDDDDEEYQNEEDEDEDVDLTSWGLDSLMPPKPENKGKAVPRPTKRSGPARLRPASEHLDNLPNPYSPQSTENDHSALTQLPPRRRPSNAAAAARSATVYGDIGRHLYLDGHEPSSADAVAATFPLAGPARRHTIAMPDEFGEMTGADPTPLIPPPPRPHSRSTIGPLVTPLPSSRPASALDMLADEDNAFAVPLPPPERMSKFDPKAARRSRTLSGGSWISNDELNDARAKALRVTEDGVLDDFDGRSVAGMTGTGAPSVMTGIAEAGNRNSQFPTSLSVAENADRRLSRLELMRPKVLIMPSPLRDRNNDPDPTADELRRRGGGFADSTGDRPLPVGFRSTNSVLNQAGLGPGTGRPSMGARPPTMALGAPGVPPEGGLSELLAPNPRMSMSTSQLMFRNTLAGIDGQRDVSYQDIEGRMQRATQDGEKIEVYEEDEREIENAYNEMHHPTGKLMGKSLMDALEARKAEIKGKRRVFTGDNRPSMMERSKPSASGAGLQRKSTLIDPASFDMPQIAVVDNQGRPIRETADQNKAGRPLRPGDKRASKGPLLTFDESKPGMGGGALSPGRPGMKPRASVFGVDTLWEKEVSKLERIKQAEEEEAAAERLREEEEKRAFAEAYAGGKKGKKGSKRKPGAEGTPTSPGGDEATSPGAPPSPGAPVLPDISRVSTSGRPRPAPVQDDEDDMAEFGATKATKERRRTSTATLGVKGWFAGGSDDEDDGSRAVTPNSNSAMTPAGSLSRPGLVASGSGRGSFAGLNSALAPVMDDDEEDEDLPLTQVRASVFMRPPQPPADDSDEDAPLVTLKPKAQLSPAPSAPKPTSNDDDSDEDNVPLGLRASTMFPSSFNMPR
ncbi:hypothetical protein DL93DRAFT_1845188 [Clavulina sp. PMI_390]|nr:hypothetical protein DL93DRAFT_1845188 [Clavulina sp. PMI_390]